MIILLGFTTHDRRTPPKVVYCGNSGDEAQSALAKSADQFVRVGKLVNPQLIPVQLPETAAQVSAREDAAAKAESARLAADATAKRAAAKFAQERAAKELAEAQALLEQVEGTPENAALRQRLAKEQAEAEAAAAKAAEAEAAAKAAEAEAAATNVKPSKSKK